MEERIEATNKYFNHLSDIIIRKKKKNNELGTDNGDAVCHNHMDELDERGQMEEIKKRFFKINRMIRKKEEEGKLKK